MLHLSTVRQHFDSGFSSVRSLVEYLKQQIESLTLVNQSSSHIRQLEQTLSVQRQETGRLSKTVDNTLPSRSGGILPNSLLFVFRQEAGRKSARMPPESALKGKPLIFNRLKGSPKLVKETRKL